MTTKIITAEQLEADLLTELKPYGWSVDDFLNSDLDSHSIGELRDLWLMVKNVLRPNNGTLS